MKQQNPPFRKLAGIALAALAFVFPSCKTLGPKADDYAQPAHRPHNQGDVVVKVSLSKQMVYVMEGNKPLLVKFQLRPDPLAK